MRTIHPDVVDLGAKIVVIGNGKPYQAEAFAAEYDLPFTLLTDPTRTSYQSLGMKRPILALFNPKTLKFGARAFKAGFRQGRTQGDALQLGGTVIISADQEVLYKHVQRVPGDTADLQIVLSELRKVVKASA